VSVPNSRTQVDPVSFVRPELRALGVYHLDLSPCRHKLDQNEVPYELPRRLKERVARELVERDWKTYPDFHSDDLRHALGERHGWPMEGVLVGNGSNELLGIALEALAPSGGEVLSLLPGFGLYRMFIERAGARPKFLGPADDLRLPMGELVAELERDPARPVILCTPNNPTGDAATPEEVERVVELARAPVLLDNAYGEFCDHDYRPLLARHRHLLLFRTFSKAWSLAGLRLGYLLADPELVRELMKVKLPYNVGFGSALAGSAVLLASAAAERRVRAILGRRGQWREMLEALGFEVFPSQANFFLARCPESLGDDRSAVVQRGLEERGIRVRDVSHYPGLAGCLRFSVGSGPALRDTRRALEEILESRILESRILESRILEKQ